MKLNGIGLVSYAERANEVTFVLEGADLQDALDLDGETLTVSDVSGKAVKVFAGYQVASVGWQGEYVSMRAVRKLDESTADAIEQLDANVAIAQSTADNALEAAQSAGTDPAVEAFARIAIVPMAATMTDEQALETSTLWPEWSETAHYVVDDIVRHGAHLYRCEQEHDSQASWTPDASPSLWSVIDIAEDGVEVWTQPTGAHNAYNIGDKVHYPTKDDPIYVSTIDGNVWAPTAYPQGWTLEAGE